MATNSQAELRSLSRRMFELDQQPGNERDCHELLGQWAALVRTSEAPEVSELGLSPRALVRMAYVLTALERIAGARPPGSAWRRPPASHHLSRPSPCGAGSPNPTPWTN